MNEDLKILKRAQEIIEALSNGKDPYNNTDTDILKNDRLLSCFNYVSKVLKKNIENGEYRSSHFFLSNDILKQFELSETPMSLSNIVSRLNDLKKDYMDKLKVDAVRLWLINQGILETEQNNDIKRTLATDKALKLGIENIKKIDFGKSFTAVYYNKTGQQYILNNLNEIVNYFYNDYTPLKKNKTKKLNSIKNIYKDNLWTEHELYRLLSEYRDGKTIEDIALIHNRDIISIENKLKEQGIDIENF